MTIHSVISAGIFVLLLMAYLQIYRGVQPGKETSDIAVAVIQNTISAGLTVVSIVLPLTLGILGYSADHGKKATKVLFFACVLFVISLAGGIWNLFRLPGLIKTVNIANDVKTAIFELIQLYCLLYGFVYLVLGAWKMLK